jgi:PKD repeat protein
VILIFEGSAQPNYHFPKSKSVVIENTVLIKWGFEISSNFYDLQISKDSTFGNIILQSITSDRHFVFTNATISGKYFWRVKPTTSNQYLSFYSFERFFLNSINNISIWLDAENSLQLDASNKISSWDDRSGNSNHFIQPNSSERPSIIVENKLNNRHVVSFNGINSSLKALQDIEIGSVFMIANWAGVDTIFPNYNCLLGNYSSGNFVFVFLGDLGTKNFYTPSSLFTNNLKVNNKFTLNNSPFSDYKILSGTVTPTIGKLSIGIDRTNFDRCWNGNVAELLILNREANDTENRKILAYFSSKYCPNVDLGRDTLMTSLCNASLNAGTRFKSYKWSNGSTSDKITIKESGVYWVEVEDIFGNISADTINVTINGLKNPAINTICREGATLFWDTKLKKSDFQFKWNNNPSLNDSILPITTKGTYLLSIKDQSNCEVLDTLVISADTIPIAYLGINRGICNGENLELIRGKSSTQGYLWSNGSIASFITITASGTYLVTTTSIFGCKTVSGVNLSISGFAPQVNFSFDSLCLGKNISFIDLSSAPLGENIVKRYWQFNQSSIDSINTNPSVLITQTGLFNARLTVKASNSCSNSIEKNINIYPSPIINFSNTNVCTGLPMNFAATSTLSSGFIQNWNWNFGVNANSIAIVQNPVYIFSSAGVFSILLSARSNKGCLSNQVSKPISIKTSLPANFSYTSECFDKTVKFTDNTQYPDTIAALNRLWDLGDSTFSSLLSPSKKYESAGIYPVKFTLTSTNGCVNSISKNIIVKGFPKADFSFKNTCLGDSTELFDMSISPTGSIDGYNWSIENRVFFDNIPNPKIYLKDTISYQIKLKVNVSGCESDTTKPIKIQPKPKAAFSYNQNINDFPAIVSIKNETEHATQFYWHFSSFESQEKNPVFQIPSSGLYDIRLKAFNQFGCKDSVNKQIGFTTPMYDISLENIFTVVNSLDDLFKINLKISNKGNRDIDSVWAKTKVSGGVESKILLLLSLNPNTDTVLTLPTIYSAKNISHYCVQVDLTTPKKDKNLSNNEKCDVIGNQSIVYNIYPNPTNEDIKYSFALIENQKVEINLLEAKGNSVFNKIWEGQKGYFTDKISIMGLNSGLYILKIKLGDKENIQKVIVIK